MNIEIETIVKSTLDNVWSAWTTPENIICWNFASDDWCCSNAIIEIEENKQFNYRMEAKDASIGFNFIGTFTKIIKNELIEYLIEDGRKVIISFKKTDMGILISESFEAENMNPPELQKEGWQSILDNFNFLHTLGCFHRINLK